MRAGASSVLSAPGIGIDTFGAIHFGTNITVHSPSARALTESATHSASAHKSLGKPGAATRLRPFMITFLDGILVEALPTQVVVSTGGIGYQVLIPLSSFDRLPAPGAPIKILTHLQVREDAHILYGFMSSSERDLFRLLVNHVSGVGPKLALAVLSGMTVANFKSAVVSSDSASLAKISGLGKKTAERIILELKDKVGVAAAWEAASASHAPTAEETQINDAVLALIALGYKQVDAHKAVKASAAPGVTAEDLVRQSLKRLI